MAKLEKLTPDQEALMPVLRDEWIERALGGGTQLKLSEARPHIDWLYGLASLEPPALVVVVDSMLAAQYTANLLTEASVRASVRDSVWASVWDSVRDSVRDSVWASVWDSVRDSKLKWHDFLGYGLGWSSGWVAFYDYFHRIGVVDHENFKRWRDFVSLGVWDMILFKGVAIVCSAPAKVHRDLRGRLHRLDGPAVEWRDGWRNYAISGVRMDKDADLIETPSRITKERILQEENVEVRKALIQILGVGRFLEMTDARTLDEDTDRAGMPRRLLQLNAGRGALWCVIEVECPSKRDKHYLWVPPESKTCSEAVAWTFGFTGELFKNYRPLVEA